MSLDLYRSQIWYAQSVLNSAVTGAICHVLSTDATILFVSVIVLSRLDFCNSLLSGIFEYPLKWCTYNADMAVPCETAAVSVRSVYTSPAL